MGFSIEWGVYYCIGGCYYESGLAGGVLFCHRLVLLGSKQICTVEKKFWNFRNRFSVMIVDILRSNFVYR